MALTGDAAQGETVFRKCRACHEVGEGARARTGPVLNGVVGGTVAVQEGFRYSDALAAFGRDNPVWTVPLLDAYLAKPRDLVPGTRMTFAGLRKEEERADVIAYLATFDGEAAPTEAAFSVPPEILALEGDVAYGEYLSSECTTCHRADGSAQGIPSITGLDSDTFITALHAYRAGAREHPVMQMIAGRLSDEEIASLAAYFNESE